MDASQKVQPTALSKSPPALVLLASLAVGMAVAITAVVEPRVTLAGTAALAFLVVYVYRRHWLLVAIFIALSFQNLAYIRLMPINSQLAAAVKHADDIFAVFLAVALVAEMFFPAVRLNRFPQWQQFIGLLGVCVLSAAYNHVPLTSAATGVYMLIKCFVWFLLASSIKLDERGWRFLFRAWLIMLGVILAFAVFQFFTGELTYNLLGLKSDYRFGILRLRSIFLYPVYLAEAMGLLAAISIGAFLQWRKPAYLALGLAALAAVVLTMTAKAILSLGFAVGFLLLRKRARLIVPYAIVAVIAILTLPEYGLRNLERQFRVYVESPRSSRRESYRIAGEILRDSPVFGAGPGMFGGYAATLLESPTLDKYAFINYVGVEMSTLDTFWPHLAGEIGLLGLAAYLWFLWRAGRASWRLASRREAPPHAQVLGTAACVFLIAAALEAFAAPNLEDAFCCFMVFSMLGLTNQHRLR